MHIEKYRALPDSAVKGILHELKRVRDLSHEKRAMFMRELDVQAAIFKTFHEAGQKATRQTGKNYGDTLKRLENYVRKSVSCLEELNPTFRIVFNAEFINVWGQLESEHVSELFGIKQPSSDFITDSSFDDVNRLSEKIFRNIMSSLAGLYAITKVLHKRPKTGLKGVSLRQTVAKDFGIESIKVLSQIFQKYTNKRPAANRDGVFHKIACHFLSAIRGKEVKDCYPTLRTALSDKH